MFLITVAATAAVLLLYFLFGKIIGNDLKISFINIFIILLLSVVYGWIIWLVRPAVGVNFPAGWVWLFAVMLAGTIIVSGSKPRFILFAPLMLLVVAVLLLSVINGRMARSAEYRDLMGDSIVRTESIDFTSDVEPVELSNLRVVDQALARQRGGTLIESIPGLGSQVELGQMNIQNLNGSFDIITGAGDSKTLSFDNELVWVGVLQPSSLFKEQTTPGYIIVSARDAGRAYFITTVNGSELAVQYSTGHYFGHNLVRYLRTQGYMTSGITDYTFELSDDGKPYYIVTLFDKTIGWKAPEARGVVMVDVESGEIKEFSIDEAPAFIDRIQPEDFITRQLNDWGKLVHGWFNSFIKQKDVLTKTEGTSLVYSGGEAYFYSGIQSAGSDRGTTGFVLVNTRTKATKMYRISGISEDRAGEALENAKGVKEAGYYATSAILYNIGSRPVYFSTLKGADGLVKMYGFISLKNEQILGVGTTVREALRAFETALINSNDPLSLDSVVNEISLDAVVSASVQETMSGTSYYYLMLEGYPGKEFLGSSDTFRELKWTKPGDKVKIVFPDGNSRTVSIRQFDNLNMILD